MGTKLCKLCVCPAMGCVCCNNIALSLVLAPFGRKGSVMIDLMVTMIFRGKFHLHMLLCSVEPGRG